MTSTPGPHRLDHVVPLTEARLTAARNGWREKVLIYLTRDPSELLVLEHTDEYPTAGVQVPGGGVEPGEQPAAAAVRELAEETGLHSRSPAVYLESRIWDQAVAPSMVRHYFWVAAPADAPDRWSHVVTAGEEDEGMLFWLTFRSRNTAGLTAGYGWDSALDRLDSVLSARDH
ncbi:NUDIX hydrolase [Microlunatus soli]|uniref:NUDIX domain-containing protein n=1 Tax=Microlunatus soli TaxID=630515 RepID=A0A1H2AFD8_9ACTN|nr:NUDIX domain-containing protein [Microlunatus soli]SDT44634.1 NUDIX domain-containing protein [Microlunatus soli]